MKRSAAVILFAFILGACATKNAPLPLANVVDSLNEDGIHLTEINDIDPDYAFKKDLNDVIPPCSV